MRVTFSAADRLVRLRAREFASGETELVTFDMRTVMGVGLVACGILMVVNRLLRLLFWSRVRTVNPALWAARRQSWGGASVIGPRRFSTTRVFFATWKKDWEPEFGTLADSQLDRLAGLLRGFFFAMAGLWACLFAVALVYEVWSKF